MRNRRVLTICVLAVTIVIGGSAASASAESKSDAECRQRLKTVYEALKEYVEINEAMPVTLFELLDLGLVEDAAVLFDPRGIGIGDHGQAQLCTPFEVVATDMAGDLLVSDEPYEGRMFVLRADGSIVVRAVNVDEYYGPTPEPSKDQSIDRGDLEEPSVGLGVIVGSRDDQVVVQTIIPGYTTAEGRARRMNDLRPGDRLINIEGRRITAQEDLEDYLRTIGPLETYGVLRPQVLLLRDGQLLRRRAMTPLFTIGARREDAPSAVHHRAQVYLHSAGPGAMGIMAGKGPSGGVVVNSLISDEARAKLRVGDVITHVEDTPVNDVDEINAQIRFHLAGMAVNLRVVRDGGEPKTVKFVLSAVDAQTLARGRFGIHQGMLDADAALKDSASQLAISVMVMLEEARSPKAALQWAERAIAKPTPNQQMQIPMILEARADLLAKLGRIDDAVDGYDKAADAWGIPSGAWGARRKQAEVLIENGRLDDAKGLTREWDLAGDDEARRAAMNVAYSYAAYGGMSEATRLLEKLQAIPETKERAASMLEMLRKTPPSRRPGPAGARDKDRDKLISDMVMAASENNLQRLEELLGSASMGPDVLSREVTSPLAIAAARGHAKSVTMLLDAGADPNQRYTGWHSRGNTPLIFATEAGHENIVYLLAKNGADINCAGGKGQTPLMIAAAKKKTDVVRQLLDRGAKVNRTVVDREGLPYGGYSALMVAAMNGHEDIVRMLLASGAKADLRGTDGTTARSLAKAKGHTGVVTLIAESER